MRALAMTGIETASMIPSIIEGSHMRATPPAARMSAGTRSSAMTATAPASSAILAWSGVTTSMMTPPLSIWARPVLVAQVDVSTVMRASIPLVGRARFAGRVWPRGPRPFESAEPRARSDYGTSVATSYPAVRRPAPNVNRVMSSGNTDQANALTGRSSQSPPSAQFAAFAS